MAWDVKSSENKSHKYVDEITHLTASIAGKIDRTEPVGNIADSEDMWHR